MTTAVPSAKAASPTAIARALSATTTAAPAKTAPSATETTKAPSAMMTAAPSATTTAPSAKAASPTAIVRAPSATMSVAPVASTTKTPARISLRAMPLPPLRASAQSAVRALFAMTISVPANIANIAAPIARAPSARIVLVAKGKARDSRVLPPSAQASGDPRQLLRA